MNPQIAYGEDVIARMMRARKSSAETALMQRLLIEAINQTAIDLCTEIGSKPEKIVEAVVVGNTVLHHLFLRLPVEHLSKAPFIPAVRDALDVKARDLGIQIAPGAYIHLLPNIAGYVGADHVAALLAGDVRQAQGVFLFIDIGTNTEICLVGEGKMCSVSCASGPAFEGAHIKHGMRAAEGAIERLRLVGDRLEYQTIGGIPPVGLCGSGVLDTIAQLYLAGILDSRGRMQDHPRVHGRDETREFILVNESKNGNRPAITLTQQDVWEIQMAKGAIRAGIKMLVDANGYAENDLDQVIIAGAFGTYIDVVSAVQIGMFPPLSFDRFKQVGNAAGIGAKLALISRSKRLEAQEISRQVGYLELATTPHFAKTFARATYMG